MPQSEYDKLEKLEEKILLARNNEKKNSTKIVANKNLNYAWRMVLELVIGMFLGFGVGYTIDYWLGTKPLMLIIMSLFGFAAGVRTMVRTAAEFARKEKEIGEK